MPRCSFTFGQIEELLAKAHRIDPAKRTAFQGRLKHLQRWGFPSGEKPGKGKSIRYTAEHLYMMVLAMELIQAGMPPKLSADLIRDNWHDLRTTTYLNMFSERERRESGNEDTSDWCWLFRPEAMRDITSDGTSKFDHYEAVQAIGLSSLTKFLSAEGDAFGGVLGRSWRTLVINGGPLVRGVALLIETEFDWAKIVDLRHDMLEATENAQQEMEEAVQSFRASIGDWTPPKRAKRPVAERYPELIVSSAIETLELHHELLNKIIVPDGEDVRINPEEVEILRDAGIIAVEIEGLVMTEKGQLIKELLEEERAHGDRP